MRLPPFVGSDTGVWGVVGPFRDNNRTWTAQLITGADYPLTDVILIGGRYRAQWVGPITVNDGAVINTDGSFWQSVEVVLKFKVR